MNKKFLTSWAAVFVVSMLGGFLIHAVWLDAIYQGMTNIMRPAAEQEALFHFMLLGHAIMAAAFVWIYERGKEDKPWLQQGLRIGDRYSVGSRIPEPTHRVGFSAVIPRVLL